MVNYNCCIFTIQRINIKLVRFETNLVSIKSPKDLKPLTWMKHRIRYCDGEVFSTVMSEGNLKIFNALLEDLYDEDDFVKETELFLILNKEFKLTKLY